MAMFSFSPFAVATRARKSLQQRRILMLLHADITSHGDRDAHEASHTDIPTSVRQNANSGNVFVYDSILKLLECDTIDNYNYEKQLPMPEDIERINALYDCIVIRGSNCVHNQECWLPSPEILAQITIPVVPIGIGIQGAIGESICLDAGIKKSMQMIAERCVSIGVRGERTADVLRNAGITNVEVIGCPVLFRWRMPDLQICPGEHRHVQNVGFSIRRYADEQYTHDYDRYHSFHTGTLREFLRCFDVTIMAQSGWEEKAIARKYVPLLEQAMQSLIQGKWIRSADDELFDLFFYNTFYSDIATDYDMLVRKLDFVTGFRVHSNIIALANGVPAVFFVYDQRSQELAETFQAPIFNIYENEAFDWKIFYQQSQFDAFNARYRALYKRMGDFLQANGLPHRM